ESHVAQAPRVVGHARVVVFSAGYAPADERESPVRQTTRKLDRDIRALHRAEVAHPQNVDVLGVRRRTLRRLDGDVEDLALDAEMPREELALMNGLCRNQRRVREPVFVQPAVAPRS